jgi:hypothetical protein
MLPVLNKFFGHKSVSIADSQVSKILLDIGPAKTDEKFDGWYHFIKDLVTSAKQQSDAYEWVKDSGGCKYDLVVWRAIASHINFRTNRHPSLEAIKLLDHQAVNNWDYINQLAYNCMRYEAELLAAPDQQALDTLREITASLVSE